MSVQYDVAIVGAGPAGLSAAVELKKQGVARVVVLERFEQAGGIPRHCGHPPFGMREFRRVLSGPAYARRLVATAARHVLPFLAACRLAGDDRAAGPPGLAAVPARRGAPAGGAAG